MSSGRDLEGDVSCSHLDWGQLVHVDGEVVRCAGEERVAVTHGLGRLEAVRVDDVVAGDRQRCTGAADTGVIACRRPPSARAGPTLPIQSPHARIMASFSSWESSGIGPSIWP